MDLFFFLLHFWKIFYCGIHKFGSVPFHVSRSIYISYFKSDNKLTSIHLSPRPCTFQADIDKSLIIVHMYKFNNKNMIYWCKSVCSMIYRFVQRKITLFFFHCEYLQIQFFLNFTSLIKRKTIGRHFSTYGLWFVLYKLIIYVKVSLIKQIIRNKQKNINKCFLSSR